MNQKLILTFIGEDLPTLSETFFRHDVGGAEFRSTRGKTAGAFIGYGTFQWTSAVIALSMLLIRTKLNNGNCSAYIEGLRGSLACSLDESISKETAWLSDMFGTHTSGRQYITSLILRSNSGMKREGPVTLAINPRHLRPEQITVIHGSDEIANAEQLIKLEKSIEKGWRKTAAPKDARLSFYTEDDLLKVA